MSDNYSASRDDKRATPNLSVRTRTQAVLPRLSSILEAPQNLSVVHTFVHKPERNQPTEPHGVDAQSTLSSICWSPTNAVDLLSHPLKVETESAVVSQRSTTFDNGFQACSDISRSSRPAIISLIVLRRCLAIGPGTLWKMPCSHWLNRTSSTKEFDNAVIGYSELQGIGNTPT